MKNIRDKMLLIIALILIIITSLFTSCFADTVSKDFVINDSLTITCSEYDDTKTDYVIAYSSDKNYYYLVCWNSSVCEVGASYNDYGSLQFYCFLSDGSPYQGMTTFDCYKPSVTSPVFTLCSSNKNNTGIGEYSIISSTKTLYETVYTTVNGNTVFQKNDTVVFQSAPLTTLAPIVEQTGTEQVTQEIVGVLPIVLIVLVGMIAVVKAIHFLMTSLRNS